MLSSFFPLNTLIKLHTCDCILYTNRYSNKHIRVEYINSTENISLSIFFRKPPVQILLSTIVILLHKINNQHAC